MRDEYDRRAVIFQPADDAEQVRNVLFGQRSGRFVQNQNGRIAGKRLRDHQHLLLADAHLSRVQIDINVQLQVVNQRLRLTSKRSLIYKERLFSQC